MTTITKEFLQAGKSEWGGWNEEQFELLGLRWPLEKGWYKRILNRGIADEKAKRFIELRGKSRRQLRKAVKEAVKENMAQAPRLF